MCPDKEKVLPMRCVVNEKLVDDEVDTSKDMDEDSKFVGSKNDRTCLRSHKSNEREVEYVPKIKWPDLLVQILSMEDVFMDFTSCLRRPNFSHLYGLSL